MDCLSFKRVVDFTSSLSPSELLKDEIRAIVRTGVAGLQRRNMTEVEILTDGGASAMVRMETRSARSFLHPVFDN